VGGDGGDGGLGGNAGAGIGGGIYHQSGNAHIKNTMMAGNVGGDYPDLVYTGVFISYGYNLIGNVGSQNFDTNTVGDQYGDDPLSGTTTENPGATEEIAPFDPMLGPLGNNGGDTPTHALLLGSPAINAGSCTDISGNPVTQDQRGLERRGGMDPCDIGAFEVQSVDFMFDQADSHLASGQLYRDGFHQQLEVTATVGYKDTLAELQQDAAVDALIKADYWYRRVLEFEPGNADALTGTLDARWELCTAYLLRGNDDLVHGLSVHSGLEGTALNDLNDAIVQFDAAVNVWREILSDVRYASHIQAMEVGRVDPLGNGDHPDYRRFARAAARRSRAYLEKGRYLFNEMDTQETEDTFRLGLHLARADAALLSRLWPGAVDTPDYKLLQKNIAEMERLFDYVLAGLNPYGIGPDFVPFWYDPDNGIRNNYEQLHDYLTENPNNPIDMGRLLEEQALANERANDDHYAKTAERFNDLRLQYDSQLADLCGENSSNEPDLENCEANPAGQIYIQLSRTRAAQERVRGVEYAMEKIVKQIRIEEERAGKVIGIYKANAALITETGDKLADLAEEEARLRQRQNEIQAMDNLIGGLVSGVSSSIAGGVSGFLTGGPVGAAAGALSGLGSATNAVLAYNSSSEMNDIIGKTGDLAAQREQLRAYQQAQLQLANGQIEDANSQARIKNLFLEMPALDIEFSIAQEALLQEIGQLNNLIQRKERLVRQKAEAQAFTASVTQFRDPGYRVLRDYYTMMATDALEYNKELTYQLARALEYEINQDVNFANILACGHPLQTVDDIYRIRDMITLESAICQIDTAYHNFLNRDDVPVAQDRETTLYLSKALGFGDYYDPYLDRIVTREEQFNDFVRDSANRDPDGNLIINFSTSIMQGNPFFGAGVFNDKIRSIQARIWGNDLGDDRAVIYLRQGGTSFIRAVDAYPNGNLDQDVIHEYNIEPLVSSIMAATNLNALAPSVAINREFGTRSVAFTNWTLVINTTLEADNFDVDIDSIEEIQLDITHETYTLQSIMSDGSSTTLAAEGDTLSRMLLADDAVTEPCLADPDAGIPEALQSPDLREYQPIDWQVIQQHDNDVQ